MLGFKGPAHACGPCQGWSVWLSQSARGFIRIGEGHARPGLGGTAGALQGLTLRRVLKELVATGSHPAVTNGG
jgi:hypothetical protein